MRAAREGTGALAGRRTWRPLFAVLSSAPLFLLVAACGEEPAKDGDAQLVVLRDDITTSSARAVVDSTTSVAVAGPLPSYVPPDVGEAPLNPVRTSANRPSGTSSPSTGSSAPAETTSPSPGTTVPSSSSTSAPTTSTTGPPRPQRLTIGGPATTVRLDQSPLTITVAGLGGPVIADVTVSGGCSIRGYELTLLAVGTCLVRAEAPAQNGYAAAGSSTSLTISKGIPVITAAITDGGRHPYTPDGVAIGAVATGGRSVTVTAGPTAAGCTVVGGRAVPGAATAPLCTLTLLSAGDENWEPASRSIAIEFVPVPVTWTLHWTGTEPVGEEGTFPLHVRLTQPDVSLDADLLTRITVAGVAGQCSDGVAVPPTGRDAVFIVTAGPLVDHCDLTIRVTPFEWYVPAGPGVVSVPVTHAAVAPPPTPA